MSGTTIKLNRRGGGTTPETVTGTTGGGGNVTRPDATKTQRRIIGGDDFTIGSAKLSDVAPQLAAIQKSEPFKDLLVEAKAAHGGTGMLEPEHLVLTLAEKRGVPVDEESRQALLNAAKTAPRPEDGGKGIFSDRAAGLLHAVAELAKQEGASPSPEHLHTLLSAPSTQDSYAQAYQRLRNSSRTSAAQAEAPEKAERAKLRPLDASQFPTAASGQDLSAAASESPFDRAVGREKAIEQLFMFLGQRDNPNVVLEGTPGVGKTAVVKELANRAALGELPASFGEGHFIAIGATKLNQMGQSCQGGQCGTVLEKLAAEAKVALGQKPPKRLVLFVDEIHKLSEDMKEALKDFSGSGDMARVQIIGATSKYDEFAGNDPALTNRFPSLHLDPLDSASTKQGAIQNRERYEAFHGVQIAPSGIEMADRLQHLAEDFERPRSTIRWLDAAASLVKLQLEREPAQLLSLRTEITQFQNAISDIQAQVDDPEMPATVASLNTRLTELLDEYESLSTTAKEEKRLLGELDVSLERLRGLEKDLESADASSTVPADIATVREEIAQTRAELDALPQRLYHLTVDGAAVAAAIVVAKGGKVSLDQLARGESRDYSKFEEELGKRVFGQDEPKETVASLLRLDHAQMRDTTKPIGFVLQVGPTGVGKTELSKTVADLEFDGQLATFNCTEMMERHEVSKMLGAPPGYAGFEGGSQLEKEIQRMGGRGVVMFDEVEKAHPDFFLRIMQIQDAGGFRNNSGQWVDCTNVLFMMNSNLGTAELGQLTQADGTYSDEALAKQTVEQAFIQHMAARGGSPEVWERLTVSLFRGLSEDRAREVVRKQAGQLAEKAAAQNVSVAFSEPAIGTLLQQSYVPGRGMRRVQRALEKQITDSLAKQVLSGGIKKGDFVMVDYQPGENGAEGSFAFRPMTDDERAAHKAAQVSK